jgi:hypothetical protein
MNASILVRMENREFEKRLRTLERVKGIEPSYSAWKAAALPLSYTRMPDGLSRQNGGLNSPSGGPLNIRQFLVYIAVSINHERR